MIMGNGFLTYIVQNKNPRNLAKAKKKKNDNYRKARECNIRSI